MVSLILIGLGTTTHLLAELAPHARNQGIRDIARPATSDQLAGQFVRLASALERARELIQRGFELRVLMADNEPGVFIRQPDLLRQEPDQHFRIGAVRKVMERRAVQFRGIDLARLDKLLEAHGAIPPARAPAVNASAGHDQAVPRWRSKADKGSANHAFYFDTVATGGVVPSPDLNTARSIG